MDVIKCCFLIVVLHGCSVPIVGNDFKSMPTTVKTKENDTVLLPCYINEEIVGSSTYKVEWLKDNQLLETATASSADTEDIDMPVVHANGSLEVREVQNKDTGEYECRVFKDSEDSAFYAQSHAIEVMYPPKIKTYPEGGVVLVSLGDDIDVTCAADSVPSSIITWFAPGGNEMELLRPRERLHFAVTDRSMSGVYQCQADNGVGDPVVATIILNVAFPPELNTSRRWIHTTPGLKVVLDCEVAAAPDANVSWMRNGEPVRKNPHMFTQVHQDKYSLHIRHVVDKDFGNYTCRAENSLGVAELTVQLSGAPNPAVFKKNEMQLQGGLTEYTLVWEVDSDSPVYEYNLWFRPFRKQHTATTPIWTKLVIPAERSTGPVHSKSYTLTGLSAKTIYECVLISRNRYGWSKPSQITIFATEGADLNNSVQIDLEARIDNNVIPAEVVTIATLQYSASNSFKSALVLYCIVLLHRVI